MNSIPFRSLAVAVATTALATLASPRLAQAAVGTSPAPPSPLTAAPDTSASCPVPGHWQVPGGEVLARQRVIERAASAQVVLLGENHDDLDHHRWQLETLGALYQARPDLVLGAEMFPRRLQPVLDAWSRGELDEADFLAQTDWNKTWGLPAEHYMPIWRFARDHRIPLRALNVERSDVRKVSGGGWQALDAALRSELGQPAAPHPDYREELREVFEAHAAHLPEGHAAGAAEFERFVESQLLWDRAMAAGIAGQARQRPVVGIMGSGHIRFGHGVPHQLRDLAIDSIYSLVPVSADDCDDIRAGLADVVVAPAADGAIGNPHRQPPAQQRRADAT